MEHFVSRKAMDIDGIGQETIELLYNEGLAKNITQLYQLQKEQLLNLESLILVGATSVVICRRETGGEGIIGEGNRAHLGWNPQRTYAGASVKIRRSKILPNPQN